MRNVKEFHGNEGCSLPAAILRKIPMQLRKQIRNRKTDPESLSNIRFEVLKDNNAEDRH